MPVTYERAGAIARITISRPEALNALDYEMVQQLVAAWNELESDDDAAVAVITGDGDEAFCSGADLKTLLPLITSGGLEDEIIGPRGGTFAKFLVTKPVVAAVRGICVAGGTELLHATDIRIASEDARFGLPEPRWALFPAGGSTVRLPRQIPYCRAMEILLTGDLISAPEALKIGLVNRVLPSGDVLDAAYAVAERIAANGRVAVQAIKRSVLESSGVALEEAYAIEARHARRTLSTEDSIEGPLAFSEKRQPRFTGR
jgi:enoyl-CoA hydratase